MEVIILAGGLGTRLRSEVRDVPKCMAPIAGVPFLWYLLKYLSQFNAVTKVILSVGYLRDVIFEWIPTVKDNFDFEIEYAIEEEPLGTGGGIKLAMEHIKEDYAVILNGDTYFDVNLNKLISYHLSKTDAKLTIALKQMWNFDRYGAVVTNSEGKIIQFKEKEPCKDGYINGGVYILSKDNLIWKGQPRKFSFETSIMQTQSGLNGCVYGIPQDGYFIDIGIPEDYRKANVEFSTLFV